MIRGCDRVHYDYRIVLACYYSRVITSIEILNAIYRISSSCYMQWYHDYLCVCITITVSNYMLLSIWGFDYDFTNYNFKTNIDFHEQPLNFTSLNNYMFLVYFVRLSFLNKFKDFILNDEIIAGEIIVKSPYYL